MGRPKVTPCRNVEPVVALGRFAWPRPQALAVGPAMPVDNGLGSGACGSAASEIFSIRRPVSPQG